MSQSAENDALTHLPCDMGCQPDWHRDDCAVYIKVARCRRCGGPVPTCGPECPRDQTRVTPPGGTP